MPYKLKDKYRDKFKKKSYNQRDWREYDKSLKARGSLTIWFSEDCLSIWNQGDEGKRKKGRPSEYSKVAIETCLTLGIVYNKCLRQTEGFVESILELMAVDLKVPDHTTLSRRAKTLTIKNNARSTVCSTVLIVDSTGLKVMGEKEWMNYKHGTKQRKVWRKLHLGINEEGEILSSTLTFHAQSDCSQVEDLLNQIQVPVDTLIGDGGYDQPQTYQAIEAYQEKPLSVIIPPNTGFWPSTQKDPRSRKENIDFIKDKGRLAWQNKKEYGRRAKAENTIFRYKTIIGNKLKSKNFDNQKTEVKIAINILNKMVKLGLPKPKIAA